MAKDFKEVAKNMLIANCKRIISDYEKKYSVTHNLKIKPKYFKEVFNGNKTFEVRKNDRNFKVGDIIVLHEYDDGYTTESITKTITYILADKEYIKEGYVILGIK